MLREFSDRVPELPTRRPLLCSWQFWAGSAAGLTMLSVAAWLLSLEPGDRHEGLRANALVLKR